MCANTLILHRTELTTKSNKHIEVEAIQFEFIFGDIIVAYLCFLDN